MVAALIALLLLPSAPVVAFAQPTTREACEAVAGKWGQMGLRRREVCNLPVPDAGKACTDSKDCGSACIAPETAAPGTTATGTCYGWTLLMGTCFKHVREGVVTPPLCAD